MANYGATVYLRGYLLSQGEDADAHEAAGPYSADQSGAHCR